MRSRLGWGVVCSLEIFKSGCIAYSISALFSACTYIIYIIVNFWCAYIQVVAHAQKARQYSMCLYAV